jgi:MFS family permease
MSNKLNGSVNQDFACAKSADAVIGKAPPVSSVHEPLCGLALRNYFFHALEGGLFMGGMAFLAGDSVLPALVNSLHGPNWIISLIPSMMWLGATLPSLFTAHRFERLTRYKPIIIVTGVLQRIVYAFAGLALIFLSARFPGLVLAVVALTPLLSGIAGGLTLGAWQALTMKVIPENRRASLWAVRFIIGSLIGIIAGGTVKIVLKEYPGITGFGILHLIEFGFITMSFFMFLFIKEVPHQPHAENKEGFIELFKSIPGLLRKDNAIRNYIISNMTGTGFMIMTPFLVIHLLNVTGRDNSFLGTLITAQMLGGLAGNVLAGYLGDRYGGKLPTVIGRVLFVVLAAIAVVNKSAWGSAGIFFLLGFSSPLPNVGCTALAFDICPARRRVTYLSIISAFSLPALLAASLVSTVIRETMDFFWPLALCAIISQIVSIHYLLKVPEPRNKKRHPVNPMPQIP